MTEMPNNIHSQKRLGMAKFVRDSQRGDATLSKAHVSTSDHVQNLPGMRIHTLPRRLDFLISIKGREKCCRGPSIVALLN